MIWLSLAAEARPIVVGSKAFTESVVLGEVAVDLLQDAGVEAEHRRELGGTRILWTALTTGEIDVYPEYTGTLRSEILGDPSADLAVGLAAHGIRATRSLGFSDSYALGMRSEVAGRLGIARLSDLPAHPELRVGVSNEFLAREDGWPAVRAAYGLPWAPQGLDHELAYRALADDQIDVIDLYTTDAEIAYYKLRVLVDDRKVFPEYDAVYLFRDDLPADVVAALLRAEGSISTDEMILMNAAVKLDHRSESAVAADQVRKMGITAADRSESLRDVFVRTTLEHLRLVGLSLLASTVLAVPLGIASAKVPRLSPIVLGAAGLLQTIPSIALLVALIPVLGIGERPAIFALVLYGLLPIARNTHAGLAGIPRPLQEAAEALGLPAWTRLWRIELPLAAGAIWAGIETAAVIDVGTATVGALVGAGGYGQPILTGIRLARPDLILLGAAPAAAMALGLQLVFGRLARWLTPTGSAGRRAVG